MVVVFCFQVPRWQSCSPVGDQPLRFARLQPFGVYPWQAYVPPSDGLWPMPGVHQVAAPLTALSRVGTFLLLIQLSQPFHQYNGAYSFGGFGTESLDYSACPTWWAGVFSRFAHLMTWSVLNLWCVLNLVTLVW